MNWPKARLGELYDRWTECLSIAGQYDQSDSRIDEFIKIMPGDPIGDKLLVRKIQNALGRENYDMAASRANEFLSSHPAANAYRADAGKLLAEAQALKGTPVPGTAESARQNYDRKNFVRAAAQYKALLEKDTAAAQDPEIVNRYSECLDITGQFDEANHVIDAFISRNPKNAVNRDLLMRKVRIAYLLNDSTSTAQLARDFLLAYADRREACAPVEKMLVEALDRGGRRQEAVDAAQQILDQDPKHPFYAELRARQGDILADSLKNDDAALAKYADALARASHDSPTYENCAYRMGDILLRQAKAVGAADAKNADELTSRGTRYWNEFLNHPGAKKIYPGNAKRRLTVLKRLKQFAEMEKEAAEYLSDANYVHPTERSAVTKIAGKPVQGGVAPNENSEEKIAFRSVQAAYFDNNFEKTIQQAHAFIAKYPAQTQDLYRAQSMLVEAQTKLRKASDLVDFVDQVLGANPNHPTYAEFRRAEADAYYDVLKDYPNAIRQYEDAMKHTSRDGDLYDWCCYRSGDALMGHATAVANRDAKLSADLKVRGRQRLEEYLDLPSNARIYPANVQRRMMACHRIEKYDQMEREAAHYLADTRKNNVAGCLRVLRMLSVSQSVRPEPDQKGALASFDELRARDTQFSDMDEKFNCGLAMMHAVDKLRKSGAAQEDVDKLKATGRKFLMDALQDKNLRDSKRMDAYYLLGDWAALNAEAARVLEKTDPADAGARAELMNWIGVALASQTPRDTEGALGWFDKTLQEYDKRPELVKDRAVIATYWCLYLLTANAQKDRARPYYEKLSTLPNSEMRTKLISNYKYLNQE